MQMTLQDISKMYRMSCIVSKPTFRICQKQRSRSASQAAKLISAFVFATRLVQFIYFLNPKFSASSRLLCLYSSVCVRKPHCWFSHDAAQMFLAKKICYCICRRAYTFMNHISGSTQGALNPSRHHSTIVDWDVKVTYIER